jgi:ribosomal protein S5
MRIITVNTGKMFRFELGLIVGTENGKIKHGKQSKTACSDNIESKTIVFTIE